MTGVAGGFLDQMQEHTSNAAIVRVGKPWCSRQWYGSAEVVDRTDATVGLGRSGLVLSEHSGQYLNLANLEAVHISAIAADWSSSPASAHCSIRQPDPLTVRQVFD